jgi:cell division septation protein DedD
MFVQIGIFSVEANAKRAQSQMSKAGVIATIKKEQSQSKTFWRVIAGPAPSQSDLNALKTTIRGLGYPDAYPVSN